MRRPAPKTLAELRHPGTPSDNRKPYAQCRAEPVTVALPADQPILETLGRWAEENGFASAVLRLDGLDLANFDYVMPDRPVDDRHAAWYSDTRKSGGSVLTEAVGILGRKDGAWFAHIHAFWHDGGKDHLGHLLPQTLIAAKDCTVRGYGVIGAHFEAAFDPETEFTLFRVKEDALATQGQPANALIATLAPFEDLYDSVASLAKALGCESYDVSGLGSLAGAEFGDGSSMKALISEILLQTSAGGKKNQELFLPIRAVDHEGKLHNGQAIPGKVPTLVTCELLLRNSSA